jgi:two-component system sensor kinase FixL
LRDILQDVVRESKRAGDIIKQLRALYKKGDLNFVNVELASAIRDVARFLHWDILNRNVRLVLEIAPDLRPVRGDLAQIQQVLINLLLNSFEAMQGRPSSERVVTISASLDTDPFVRVAVRDQGPGIAPDKLDTVFEPFFTTKSEGMGMGLAISRTIIEAHEGRLWVENCPDGGAVFYFTVPLAEKDSPVTARSHFAPAT